VALGSKLNQLRLRKGESLQQAADGVGISKAHFWELEKGISKNPSIDLIRKIAMHFNVSDEFLLDMATKRVTPDEEAMIFFREISQLTKKDQMFVRQTIDHLKKTTKK
jgi:transcriptional regulator with XRE-family HTH domain